MILVTLVFLPLAALAAPLQSRGGVADANEIPIPGFSPIYNTYHGKAPPFPGNETTPIPPTASGPPGPDDILFQNLLAAEWIVYSFYQTAVENFTTEQFVAAGFPNTTYDRICEIRDNEAGHLRIFQDSISPTSMKPGPCQYDYGFTTPAEFMTMQVLIEISSEAFLTGLALQATLNGSKSALVAIAQVESRHNTWALMEAWGANPFTGPSDTAFPYANQVLRLTNQFVVSCPAQNPVYPSPNQNLPLMDYDTATSKGRPGDNITIKFSKGAPDIQPGSDAYAVFFHGVNNVTVPFDATTNTTRVPDFDDRGMILAVIADTPGAPTTESVLAGPLLLIEQPAKLTTAIPA